MSHLWADSLLRSSLQGGLAGLLVWAVVHAFPRIPASTQVWLWRIVALKFLLGLVLPLTIYRSEGFFPKDAVASGWLPILIGTLSGLGIALAIGAVFKDRHLASRLTQGACAYEPAEGREISRAMGLWQTPRVMVKADLPRPLLLGALSPVILLPEGLNGADRRMVLAHEIAHIRRRDLAYAWLVILLEAFFFFHPVVWLLRREIRMAQETACDSLAIQASRSSLKAYGQMLLSMTVSSSQRELALTAQMAGTYTALRQRILRLQRGEGRLGALRMSLLALMVLAILPTWRTATRPLQAPKNDLARMPVKHPKLATPLGFSPVAAKVNASKEATP